MAPLWPLLLLWGLSVTTAESTDLTNNRNADLPNSRSEETPGTLTPLGGHTAAYPTLTNVKIRLHDAGKQVTEGHAQKNGGLRATTNVTVTKKNVAMNIDDDDEEESNRKEIDEDDIDDDKEEYNELPVPMALKASKGYTRSDGTYIVNDPEGNACVMAYFKTQATIYYYDVKGNVLTKRASPEENSAVSGSCDRSGQVSELSVSWSTFILSLRFGLDDLTDSYFVSKFSLTFDLSDPTFSDAAPGGSKVTVESKAGRKFWQTHNAYSFRCLLLHDVQMSDALNNSATLHFDEVRAQAFCYDSFFRKPKHCIHRVHRDEMVPVTVGASLAASTLLTVLVYGIFRYFKVKKVQYDTME